MVESTPDDPASSPDSSRPRRAPPTIDLEASEVSEKDPGADAGSGETSSRRSFADRFPKPSMAALAPVWIAGVTGALAAAGVVAIAWALWVPRDEMRAQPSHDSNAKAIILLASRIDDLEARAARPAAPDAASATRLDGIDKSIASLRAEAAGERARSEKLASQLDAVKSASSSAAVSGDLAAIEERLSLIERTAHSQSERIAQDADKPADDTALRRLVVASMLDISVRQGEPFAATLAAARALSSDSDALLPLQNFAASGVPSPASLTRELLTLVPKLSPPAQPLSTTGSGIVDRLKAGASNLVRIERTDVTGTDRGAIVARITAAAVRNDLADSRRELEQLAPADREVAQGWLDKVKERDAALAASHRFVNEAMTALAKPAP